jgi:hypothetical protein
MNYNTDDIQRIGREVAKVVQEGIRQKETESQELQTMAAFELAFREALRQIGAEAMGIFLNGLQQTPEAKSPASVVAGCTINEGVQRSRQLCLEKWSTPERIMRVVRVGKELLR